MSRNVTYILIAFLGLLIVILGLGSFLVARDVLGDGDQADAPTATSLAQIPAEATASTVPATATLPPPVVQVLPTDTPRPTDTPSPTPRPTDTPAPTNTAEPTATNTPRPVVIVPTNTPVPPTNTPAPTSPPANTRGLTATNFGLQPRSVYAVNQLVWFEFTIVNAAGGPVPFGALGVMPKKDGTDRLDWYQHSWGGNDDSIPVNGLSWEDNIRLPEAGAYTLRLVICFEGTSACRNGGGTWVTLSQEIAININ